MAEPDKQASVSDVNLTTNAPPTTLYAFGGVVLAFLVVVICLCAVTLMEVTKIKDDMVTEVTTGGVSKEKIEYRTQEILQPAEVVVDEKMMYSESTIQGNNICQGAKPKHANATAQDYYFSNQDCMVEGVVAVLEQAGANVTKGYKGGIDTIMNATTGERRTPILEPYYSQGLCPVNVHWHLGAEHLSVGEYDTNGKSPVATTGSRKLLASEVRKGFTCHHYDSKVEKFSKEYDWKHCVGMHVGQTYEVHWPHSAAGACGTPNQYQTPFYDGVFCKGGIISLDPLNTYEKIGVQSQVYTIVNDENYYYPDMIRGMIVDGVFGQDIAYYTGSTTGTSRSNTVCSKYTPITWQVDRKCHLMSASSFDKMCADMKAQRDDMTDDLHAHGSRELVADHLAADNMVKK